MLSQKIVNEDTMLNISSSFLILLGFLAGLAIFIDVMDWVNVQRGSVVSLWFEFILCTISSLAIKYSRN
jgi:hypothetical protein